MNFNYRKLTRHGTVMCSCIEIIIIRMDRIQKENRFIVKLIFVENILNPYFHSCIYEIVI